MLDDEDELDTLEVDDLDELLALNSIWYIF